MTVKKIRLLTVLAIVAWLTDTGHHAWPQSTVYQYRLSARAIKCLVENRAALEAMNRPLIVLNLGTCPPIGLELDKVVGVQDNPLATGRIKSVDDKVVPTRLDSLVFLTSAMVPCFLKLIEPFQHSNDEVILVDLYPCRK
jgi:hypothetical protein